MAENKLPLMEARNVLENNNSFLVLSVKKVPMLEDLNEYLFNQNSKPK